MELHAVTMDACDGEDGVCQRVCRCEDVVVAAQLSCDAPNHGKTHHVVSKTILTTSIRSYTRMLR
jgi:hypothetical protein